jgi:hypothetical protein
VPGTDAFTVVVAMLLEDEMVHARHIREVFDELEPLAPLLQLVRDLTPTSFFTEVVPVGGTDVRHKFHAAGVLVMSDLVGLTHPLNRDGPVPEPRDVHGRGRDDPRGGCRPRLLGNRTGWLREAIGRQRRRPGPAPGSLGSGLTEPTGLAVGQQAAAGSRRAPGDGIAEI